MPLLSIFRWDTFLALITTLFLSHGVAAVRLLHNRDAAAGTECTQWLPVTDSSVNLCLIVPIAFGITADEFLALNPVLNGKCDEFKIGQSYYVQGSQPTGSDGNGTATDAEKLPPALTGPNGVVTPLPVQEGLTDQCKTFHLVGEDESCQDILDKYDVRLSDFVRWNPAVAKACTNMWADYYVCVGSTESSPTKAKQDSPPTPSAPGSPTSSATPSPIQQGMVKGCKKFHLVEEDEYCIDIQKEYRITMEQIYKWNPAVGKDCTKMWANTYLCVGI